ncbi:extracellular solute-binding protein [Metabacillus herbersteinensis]|uniref:Extracellular solute-binding protein n=1 Tax=Metabacillus herbersteinensis TaxID=283816 RepID=A0ABV6GF09_9BACI
MQKSNSLKKVVAGAMLAISAFSLAACGANETNTTSESEDDNVTKISLYSSGSQNVEFFWESVIPKFEESHENIDVEFVFVPSGTGGQATIDRITAAKKANKDSDVDIYEGGLADILRSEDEGGLFYDLTDDTIENLENVQEANMAGTQNLAVPYRASSVVLAYNSEKVKDVPNTAEELNAWIKENPGRFAYNDPSTGGAGSSFVLTTVYNQLDEDAMNSQDESIMEEWDEGIQILKEMAPNLYKEGIYPKKNQGALDLLANGEVDMIPAWSDMALEQMNAKLLPETTQLKQIQPAFTGGPAYLMAVDNGNEARKEASETFLNYVLTQEVQELVIEKMYGYPGIKWELLSEEDQKKFESVSDGYRIFNGGDLSGELTKVWQKEVATQ